MPKKVVLKEGDWQTPSAERISRAAARVLGDESEEPAEEETEEQPDEETAEDEPDEGSEEEESEEEAPKVQPKPAKAARPASKEAEPPARGAGKGEEDESEAVYELDGKLYTESEMREMRDGNMLRAEFTRSQQENARVRDEMARDRERLDGLITNFNAMIAQAKREVGDEGRDDARDGVEASSLSPKERGALAAMEKQINDLRTDIAQRDEAAATEARDNFLWGTYQETLNGMFEKFKVRPEEREMYELAIVGQNPDVYDSSGKLTKESIQSAVRTTFLKLRARHTNTVQKAVSERIDGLKREPKPKAAPASPAAPRRAKPVASLSRRRNDGWDTEANMDAVMSRISESANQD